MRDSSKLKYLKEDIERMIIIVNDLLKDEREKDEGVSKTTIHFLDGMLNSYNKMKDSFEYLEDK